MNCTPARRNTKAWLHYDRGIFLWGEIGKQWGHVYWLLNKTFGTYTMHKLCVCMAPEQHIVCCNITCPKNVIWRDWSSTFKSKKHHMPWLVRNVLSYWNIKCHELKLHEAQKRIRIRKEVQNLPINLAVLVGTKWPCQSKICQFQCSTFCDKYMCRLQISMQDLKKISSGEKVLMTFYHGFWYTAAPIMSPSMTDYTCFMKYIFLWNILVTVWDICFWFSKLGIILFKQQNLSSTPFTFLKTDGPKFLLSCWEDKSQKLPHSTNNY
jgi:hypothetical protein